MSRLKYFLFNKESDFRRGYRNGMDILGAGIGPKECSGKKGVFISRLLDSREVETNWHRLRIRGKGEDCWISIYAGNQRSFLYQEEEMDMEEFICRDDIALEEKKWYMTPWLQKQAVGEEDILIHEVKGRYLWLMIEMYWQHGDRRIYDIQVYFPKQSWISYLPEIYEREDRDGFLERYLGIFQSIHEDLDDEIRGIAQKFDWESARGEDLVWLAGWLDICESHIWSEEQLGRLLGNAVSMYRRRGTRRGIMEFTALYTGEYPFVVEHHQVRYFQKKKDYHRQLVQLYGDDEYVFSVLVREEVLESAWQQKALMRIMEDVKPAHMECSLVILKPFLFLGQHSYLGINSVLGRYAGLVLDGHSAISFATLQKVHEKGDN